MSKTITSSYCSLRKHTSPVNATIASVLTVLTRFPEYTPSMRGAFTTSCSMHFPHASNIYGLCKSVLNRTKQDLPQPRPEVPKLGYASETLGGGTGEVKNPNARAVFPPIKPESLAKAPIVSIFNFSAAPMCNSGCLISLARMDSGSHITWYVTLFLKSPSLFAN